MSERARAFRHWPLRRRLVTALIAILVLLTLAIGTVSIVVQRQGLVHRLDDQLRASLEMVVRGGAAGGPGGQGPAPGAPGPRLGSFEVVIAGGEVLGAELVDETGTTHALSSEEVTSLATASGSASAPHAIDVGEFGPFRVAAAQAGAGGGESTVIVGYSLAEVQQTTRDLTVIFALVGLAGVVLAGLVGGYLVRLGLRPLDRLAATAARVSTTPLSSGEVVLHERLPAGDVDPGTEVGQVGAAFNQMLDHVEHSLQVRQASEEQLRQFVADASHELRTPLAVVTGYTELAARSADHVPEQVARSLERIGSEASRMSGMVQDLLLLARLDSGARLAEQPVELAQVVVDACADAQVTGPQHTWVLELTESAGEIEVTGDADRLRQVLLNLLTNARVHTPPASRVAVRLTEEGACAIIEVEDDGPGIPAELQERIFDRFVRGDDSRAHVPDSAAPASAPRAALGTGLGMAIAQAIVTAHGGTIGLHSQPGSTTFTVRLPLADRSVGGARQRRYG